MLKPPISSIHFTIQFGVVGGGGGYRFASRPITESVSESPMKETRIEPVALAPF